MGSNRDDLGKNWYDALAAENCVLVRKFLTDDRRLLYKGWKADTHASVQFKLKRSWGGRTALHVAARRGAELTKDVLKIYSESLGEAKDQDYRPRPRSKDSNLLEVIDGDYELDALAIAVVNGNMEIVNLLNRTNLNGLPAKADDESAQDKVRDVLERKLKEITMKVLPEGSPDYNYIKNEYYDKDCDFNFLPLNLYLFHFTFSTWELNKKLDRLMKRIRTQILSLALKNLGLLKYLLGEVWDGQGRTPLHVAVDSQKVAWFCKLIRELIILEEFDGKTLDEFLNQTDSAGRTPLYRAAAKNQIGSVEELLKDPRTNVGAGIAYRADKWGADLDLDKLSWRNGFKSDSVYILEDKLQRKGFNHKSNAQAGPGPYVESLEEVESTALHVAIIHKHEKIVEKLVKKVVEKAREREDQNFHNCNRRFTWPEKVVEKARDREDQECHNCNRRFTWPASRAASKDDTPYYCERAVSTMKLAVLVGSIPILQQLLKANERRSSLFSLKSQEEEFPSFLLAAASGNPGMVKAFLDSKNGKFDPLIEDSFQNTALHHALKGTNVQFHPHLVDFVGCNHVFRWRWANSDWISDWLENPEELSSEPKDIRRTEKSDLRKKYGKRKGSINLLLQAGIDIWRKNDQNKTASPEPDAPDDFVSWWYEKVAQETKQVQAKLDAAANAISVTAALVSTASYVGPLQPPLGYDGDSIQVNILAVRAFVVCDSVSFYLALAAIMLALVPSLPLPQDSMFTELRRTRIIVAISVTFLFPSIICVLVAFAAGYIAANPEHGLSHHGLAVATTAAGGILVLFVIVWFFIQIVGLKVIKPLMLEQARRRARAKARAKVGAKADEEDGLYTQDEAEDKDEDYAKAEDEDEARAQEEDEYENEAKSELLS